MDVYVSADVDGTVREHANESKPETTVRRAHPAVFPHVLGCLYEESVAREAAFDRLTL